MPVRLVGLPQSVRPQAFGWLSAAGTEQQKRRICRACQGIFTAQGSVFASVIEIAISIIVLIAIVIAGIQVVREVFSLAGDPKAHEGFTVFLGHAFNLIIGVEFIKMLAKHTPGSAIEVLLFAIARQMVVEHTSPLENLIGIVTIALIFAIRKFLFVPSFGEHSAFHEEEETRAGALSAAGAPRRE